MSALDDVSKGLRRNDAELAVSALLKVASAERESVLPAVGALFRQAVLEVHRRGEWSRGVFWAARAEKEPRLYGLPDSDDHRAVLWALMWAAVISREFERAARLWALVRPQVEAKAPALALAIEAHIASRGSPPPALIAALNVPEPDPRLGREPTQSSSKLTLPAPTTLVSVESSVLAACSGLPWAQFADTVTTWVRTATPELARTIATLATSLAVRELLVRFSEAANSQRSVPGLLVAELIRQVGAQATMSEDVLLAFRLVASDGAQQPFANEQAARPFCALASATAAYELHRPLVVRALESRLFAPAAARSGLRLLEGLATKTLPPELFAKAVALICMEQHEFVPEAPAWLRQAWELLMKEPTDFQRWISALPERERGPM